MWKGIKRIISLLCILALCGGLAAQAEVVYAKPDKKDAESEAGDKEEDKEIGFTFYEDGDVVGFIGDSITHVEYSSISYVEFLYNFYLSRFPDRKVEFRNLGVSSYKASDILDIYDRDPAFEGITKAVILLGMNEALEKVPTEDYILNMEHLVKRLKRSGLKGEDILVLSPTPYDQTCKANFDKEGNPYRMTDDTLTEFTEQLAVKTKEWKVHYVDLHTPMLELTAKLQEEDENNTMTIWDCVHPSAMGEMAMAYYILKAQGADGQVASIISPESGEVQAVHREITDFYKGENGLRWTMKAETLPMAMTYEFQEFHQWFDLVGELNQEILKVEGMEAETPYILTVGETQVGTFTGKELEEGVNLALQETYPLEASMLEAETLNQQWHENSAEYRRIVRFATMAKPTHTNEQMLEAHEIWEIRDKELREGMYEIAREAVSQPIKVTLIREGYSPEDLEQEAVEALKQAKIQEREEEAARKEAEKAQEEAARKELIKKVAMGAAIGVAVLILIISITVLVRGLTTRRRRRGRRRR